MAAPLIPIVMALAQFAPHLMRYFGAGDTATAVTEKVVEVAQAVSGAETPEAALAAITANAELQTKFRLETLRIDAELERSYLDDRKDARSRDVEYVKAGRTNTRANAMVAMDAAGLVLGLAGMLLLGWFKARYPNEISEGVFGALIAQLSTITSYFGLCLRDAHQFEFGSSRGSSDKNELIARMNAK